MLNLSFENNFSVNAILKTLNPAIDDASAVAVSEIVARADNFTPYLNGDLQNSMELVKKAKRYVGVLYNIEYGERIYNGLESWDWTLDHHPNARPRWLHHAYDLFKSDIIKKVSKDVRDAI